MLTRQTVGIVGLLGALLLLGWAFGFIVLGIHSGTYHLLFLAAVFLILVQGIRRIDHED